jgi:hypothetical protein
LLSHKFGGQTLVRPIGKLCNSHNEKAYSSLNFMKFQNLIRQISSHNACLQNARMDFLQLPWWLTLKPSNDIFTKVT